MDATRRRAACSDRGDQLAGVAILIGLFVVLPILLFTGVHRWLFTDVPSAGTYSLTIQNSDQSAPDSAPVPVRADVSPSGTVTIYLRYSGSSIVCPKTGDQFDGFGAAATVDLPPPIFSTADYGYNPIDWECKGHPGKRLKGHTGWATFPKDKRFGRPFNLWIGDSGWKIDLNARKASYGAD